MGANIRTGGRGLLAAAAVAGLAGLGVAAPAVAVSAASGAIPAVGSWGKAIEVPGPGDLNANGSAAVWSVSCGSAGNCAAGGYYHVNADRRGFVAVERNGRWGKAIQVPGLGALNAGGDAHVGSVSCASAGNCAVGGQYYGSGGDQGFVVVERNGRWGKAIEVPGLGARNTGGYAEVNEVSCASAGNCAAGGDYRDGSSRSHGFVVVERNGRWGKAIEVPGLRALSTGRLGAGVHSVSCASAGNCAAGGYYSDRSDLVHGFVAVERNGRWGKAIQVPGLATLSAGVFGSVLSVSCGSAGNCAVVGNYVDGSGHSPGFVAVERNGRWGKAIEVPGLAALNTGGFAEVSSVSCGSAGSCAAGGTYKDGSGHYQAFLVSERNGRWGKAIQVPGLPHPIKDRSGARVLSVSCGSAGNCAAGGVNPDKSGRGQGFVVIERNGRWGKATEVPGLAALNTGGEAKVGSVSCPPAGNCAAGGGYTDHSSLNQGFVVSQAS